MHAACLEAEVPGSVSKFEPVQGATIACVTPGTRSDSVRFAHSHAQRLMTLCITKLRRAEVVLQERLKREPTPEKIAEVLGITASSEVGVTAR